MPTRQNNAIRVGLALTLVVTLDGGAQARHWHWYHYRHFGSAAVDGYAGYAGYANYERGDERSGGRATQGDERSGGRATQGDERSGGRATQGGGPLGTLMAQFIRDCQGQAVELKNFHETAIAQTVDPDDAQDLALKNARQLIGEAGDQLTRDCPNDVPADPAARFDAMERGIDAVGTALSALQPPLQAFYDSLKDNQKARLIARYLGVNPSPAPETTGSGERASSFFERSTRRRQRASADQVPGSAPAAQLWNCDQWQAELRAWPVGRVEQAIAIAPRQRAAFYGLAAAMQRAADKLEDSCPREPALTPIGRVEDLKKKLEAVRGSIAEIRPPFGQFYEVLDGAQKRRFSDAM